MKKIFFLLMLTLFATVMVACGGDDDKELVANTVKKYDLSSIAVVNKENKMVGIITVDDVIDVILIQ